MTVDRKLLKLSSIWWDACMHCFHVLYIMATTTLRLIVITARLEAVNPTQPYENSNVTSYIMTNSSEIGHWIHRLPTNKEQTLREHLPSLLQFELVWRLHWSFKTQLCIQEDPKGVLK